MIVAVVIAINYVDFNLKVKVVCSTELEVVGVVPIVGCDVGFYPFI